MPKDNNNREMLDAAEAFIHGFTKPATLLGDSLCKSTKLRLVAFSSASRTELWSKKSSNKRIRLLQCFQDILAEYADLN